MGGAAKNTEYSQDLRVASLLLPGIVSLSHGQRFQSRGCMRLKGGCIPEGRAMGTKYCVFLKEGLL